MVEGHVTTYLKTDLQNPASVLAQPRKTFCAVQFINPQIAYANKPQNAATAWTFLRNAAFRTTPRDAEVVPQLLCQIPH
jgi:hypothetical protein